MNNSIHPGLQHAQGTVTRAREILAHLTAGEGIRDISVHPRIAEQLTQYLEGHISELESTLAMEKQSPSPLNRNITIARQEAVSKAVEFVEQSFLAPRRGQQNSWILEAADRICMSGFRKFIPDDHTQSPSGPLVAIENSLSPAVWSPDAELPIPSLFDLTPNRIVRSTQSNLNGLPDLPNFPLVCLPSDLLKQPGYLALLNHEIGHAVDAYLDLTGNFITKIKGTEHEEFWHTWARELVADAVGIALSGPGFLLAFSSYARTREISDEISSSHGYPGLNLRLWFQHRMLESISPEYKNTWPPLQSLVSKLRDRPFGSSIAQHLQDEFDESICLELMSSIGKDFDQVQASWGMLDEFRTSGQTSWNEECPMHLLPSALMDLQVTDTEKAMNLLKQILGPNAENRPEWTGQQIYQPSLRPTFLEGEQRIKVPPENLLIYYDHISFIGATNGQLFEKLQKALELRRKKPWSQIEIFFGDDSLLGLVERNDIEDTIRERDEAMGQLTAYLQTGCVTEKWCLYSFRGTAVFSSYWDWNHPGGRIHVSAQLMGTNIRSCPSVDYVWNDHLPTRAYQQLREHLTQLRTSATVLKDSGQEPNYL